MLVVGPNGAGKTNLLESLHVGTQGFSPRTRADAQLIRFGEAAARIVLGGERTAGVPLELEVTLRAGQGKVGKLNGAPLRAAEQLRARGVDARLHAGPPRRGEGRAGGSPRVRRPRSRPPRAGRAWSCRRGTRRPWVSGTRRSGALRSGSPRARRWRRGRSRSRRSAPSSWPPASRCSAALRPGFARHADSLGLADATLAYEGEPPTRGAWRRGWSAISNAGRRVSGRTSTTCGSAPAPATCGSSARRASSGSPCSRSSSPRPRRSASGRARRRSCSSTTSCRSSTRSSPHARHARGRAGQTVITATTTDAMPVDPAQVVDVAPGRAGVRG